MHGFFFPRAVGPLLWRLKRVLVLLIGLMVVGYGYVALSPPG